MRTVKESMKNFFTAILCFLMNLIPERKLWSLVNTGENAKTAISLKNNRKFEKNTNYNVKNSVGIKGQVVLGNMGDKNAYKQKYVAYLYEYVDNLLINKNSIKKWNNKISRTGYADTG